ncbi:hypothetical protein BGX28_006891 [Mortierella sp. GBA30]|nr:hypothetical protein BGX28_006891 [Mortierella sp. GBA30]
MVLTQRAYSVIAPQPLADVPLYTNPIDIYVNAPDPVQPGLAQSQEQGSPATFSAGVLNSATRSGASPTHNNTTRIPKYIPQLRKAWHDRSPSMSWALSTAFFSSIICAIVAIAALVLNWSTPSTYLKVLLITFVVRKWIATCLMIDRALYRLPLGLTEPDPDIDDERHNGVAIYMSQLFTWHGYAMFLFGSLYVFLYGASHHMADAPVITGVAIAFSCMGLVPFFALLAMMLGALVLLYVIYILFVCMVWPLEKCGLSRRRAISRRNGGYRSDGITNTTDLRQVAQAIEDAEIEGGQAGRGRSMFGSVDHIKVTPAMAAVPIVIFRKPKQHIPTKTNKPAAEIAVTAGSVIGSEAARREDAVLNTMESRSRHPEITLEIMKGLEESQNQSRPVDEKEVLFTETSLSSTRSATPQDLSQQSSIERLDPDISAAATVAFAGQKSMSGNTTKTSTSRPAGDRPVTINVPPAMTSTSESQNDFLSSMPGSLSVLCTSTVSSVVNVSRSRTTSASHSMSGMVGAAPAPWMAHSYKPSQASSMASPFIPCMSGLQMDEAEARLKTAVPLETGGNIVDQDFSQPGDSRISNIHNTTRHGSSRNTFLTSDISPLVKEEAALPRDDGLGDPDVPSGSMTGSETTQEPMSEKKALSLNSLNEYYPTIHDEECAICLFDFEDGDELRHLYCDHFFHRGCVDRWLVKNAFCPKCKRSI